MGNRTCVAESLLMFLACVLVVGCTSTRGTSATGADAPELWVRDMELSTTRGEVGREFFSELSYKTNYLENPAFKVSELPAGLRWDDAKHAIVGVPTAPGFHSVNIAVRSAGEEKWHDKRQTDDRWWPADFDIEIYRPIGR